MVLRTGNNPPLIMSKACRSSQAVIFSWQHKIKIQKKKKNVLIAKEQQATPHPHPTNPPTHPPLPATTPKYPTHTRFNWFWPSQNPLFFFYSDFTLWCQIIFLFLCLSSVMRSGPGRCVAKAQQKKKRFSANKSVGGSNLSTSEVIDGRDEIMPEVGALCSVPQG